MKKVSLLIDNLGSGGAQRQIVLLASELASNQFDVSLIYYGENEHMKFMLDNSSVKTIKVRKADKGNKILRLFKIIKAIKKTSPDVLISYLDEPNKIGCVYKLLNKKTFWLASERNVVFENSKKESSWRNMFLKYSDAIVANSFTQREWMINHTRLNSNKIEVIWNGIYENFFHAFNRGPKGKSFISLGRLSYQKNPELLLNALSRIDVSKLNDYHFSWYGAVDSDDENLLLSLKNRASENCLPVSYFEPIEGVEKILASSGCLILTSRFEGTPNVVLEAMASGCFVIAPNIVDLPTILGEGRGLLYEQQDEQGLADAILEYISLREEDKLVYIEKSREYAVKNFSKEMLLQNYKRIIGEK